MADGELRVTFETPDRVSVQSLGGLAVTGTIDLDEALIDVIRLFDRWVRQERVTSTEEVAVFGTLLYRRIFSGELSATFAHVLDRVGPSEHLRVLLTFQEQVASYARLPWEFLRYPDTATDRGYFLSTDRRMTLSRFLPLSLDRDKTLAPPAERLRILVILSTPAELGTVVARPVLEAIQGLAAQMPVEIISLQQPTLDGLRERLEAARPHVLHFMGHGCFDETSGEGQVALLDEDGRHAQWVSDDAFAELVSQISPLPRLVFLHACEGGTVDFAQNFAGVAPQLVRLGVPAVVAMQYEVKNAAAVAFGKEVYRRLTAQEPVDRAVQAGRRRMAVGTQGLSPRDFGTPVLYLRSQDASLRPSFGASPGGGGGLR